MVLVGGEEAFAHQADLRREFRVREVLEVLGGLRLQVALQGTGGREVETIEVVQRAIEEPAQAAARDADAFVGFDGLNGRLGLPIAVSHLAGQCGRCELRIDHVVLRQQANMAVGQAGQFIPAFGQVMGRATLGDHQGQHFAQGQAFLRHGLRIRVSAGQPCVGLIEVSAIPDAQPFGHAVYLAVAWYGGQRHAIEVIADHVFARLKRVGPSLVSANTGGNHLSDFFPARHRQPVGRMTVFFQLSGQRATAGGLPGHMQHFRHLRPSGHAESRPIDGGVGPGQIRVEQEAVFDEQQAVNHHGRNGVEACIELLWVLVLEQGVARQSVINNPAWIFSG